MASLKLSVYNPDGSGYAPRIKEQDWQAFRPIITQLHNQRIPRKTMLKKLRKEYDFAPTIGQLQAKMKEWKLKVYVKEVNQTSKGTEKHDIELSVEPEPLTHDELKAVTQWHYNPYCLASTSGFIEAWADDYRVHPAGMTSSVEQYSTPNAIVDPDMTIQDRALPPEYLAGGVLANSADPHWPVPTDDFKCDAILRAADYYYALQAYQQAFSLYRTVYLYQRKRYNWDDKVLLVTVLRCACSAVSEHQKNIMHSVLTEIGSSPALDSLDPLTMDCLHTASLSMLSSSDADLEDEDTVRARAVAYTVLAKSVDGQTNIPHSTPDLGAMLYSFEHALLMQEHRTQVLVMLLGWCKDAIDTLQYGLEDIYVGFTSCDEEFYRRVAQFLSGHLVQCWSRSPDDGIMYSSQMAMADGKIHDEYCISFTTSETIVAVAFMVVDASRFCLNNAQHSSATPAEPNLWFRDAAKIFKRAIQHLTRLSERERCESFSRAYLERFYASMGLRKRMYWWSGQMPAIVDSVGMTIAQTTIPLESLTSSIEDAASLTTVNEPFTPIQPLACLESIEEHLICDIQPKVANVAIQWNDRMPSPFSDGGSISSFLSTHLRVVNSRLVPSSKSRTTSPCDGMSVDSTVEWRFAAVTGLRSPASEEASI